MIDSLKDFKSISEIIVIDNASTDNSMQALSSIGKMICKIREQNFGFASSCNYGAKIAKNDTLVFLNPDCFVEKNTISTLVETLYQKDRTAIVGCLINNPDGTEQRAARRRLPTLWRAIKTYSKLENLAPYCTCFTGVNLSHTPLSQTSYKVEAISGALIMMKSQVFKEINGFDEGYPLHFEDLDLFKRTIDAAYEIQFNPCVRAMHYQGVSSQSNPKVDKLKKQGLQRYFHKHCSYLSYLMIRVLSKII
jgi:GT2 family glycosyltransferase